MSVIHGPWQNQRWAANLDGQSFDDVTFADESVGGGGETLDAATVIMRLTPSGVEEVGTTDTGTVVLILTPSGVDVPVYADAATVRLTLTPSGVDVIEHPCFAGDGEAHIIWTGRGDYIWTGDANVNWYAVAHIGAGVC